MSKFHSIVSRRDFMKGIGLAGAGIGAAAATTPVFHDLDEVMSAAPSNISRPWWVKERDLLDPTVEVDWDIMTRYDRRGNAQNRNIEDYYYGDQMIAARENEDAVEEGFLKSRVPGYTRKTEAFFRGYNVCRSGQTGGWHHGWAGPSDIRLPDTPEESGLPKWQGTPEENLALVRSASRIYGAASLGTAVMDSTWKNKLLLTHTTKSTARFVIEDVDQGYEAPDPTGEMQSKWVIPSKQMYVIQFGGPEALFNIKTAPSYFSAGNRFGTRQVYGAHLGTFALFRALGYHMIGGCHGHQSMPFNAGAVAALTGQAEHCRQNQYVITPEAGTRINPENAITDFPMAPTKPIDAGIWKFCQSCGKCADTCPGGWISGAKDPTFDPDDANGKSTANMTHVVGPKSYWLDAAGCRMQRKLLGGSCHICFAECTFNEGQEAMVHKFVMSTVATTSLFNGFFANMSDTFGYGAREKEAWWDESLPVMGTLSETYAHYK